MATTSIEWCQNADGTPGKVWNPTRGCSRISPGCGAARGVGGCYAERQAARFSGPGQPYEGLVRIGKQGPRWTGKLLLVAHKLEEPLRWKKPRKVFVNSMSDLFHEALSNEEIAAVFGIMAGAPQHTFQILTKRAQRMRDWFVWAQTHPRVQGRYWGPAIGTVAADVFRNGGNQAMTDVMYRAVNKAAGVSLPLPNVHLGVSVESQKYADERIPLLLQCPAAVHWISYEPALGPIDIARYLKPTLVANNGERLQHPDPRVPTTGGTWEWGLNWVVAGGESGPGARPFDVQWAHSIVAQCRAALVPVFVKQLGANAHDSALSIVGGWTPGDPEPDTRVRLKDSHGGNMKEWPADLRVREWPKRATRTRVA